MERFPSVRVMSLSAGARNPLGDARHDLESDWTNLSRTEKANHLNSSLPVEYVETHLHIYIDIDVQRGRLRLTIQTPTSLSSSVAPWNSC